MILLAEIEKASKASSYCLGRYLAECGLKYLRFDYSLNRKSALLSDGSFFFAVLSNEGIEGGEEVFYINTDQLVCI